jgi:hypothetical protein
MGDVVQEQPPQIAWVSRGAMRNPAVVTVTLEETDSGVAITVRAAAAEGLIKQRAGEKTAALVAQRIRLAAP